METPAGLNDYPITRLCMITTVIIPLIAAITDLKYLFLLYFDPFIDQYNQYQRYLTFQLGCVNESDVILLVLIWYNFRHLERVFGSYKYLNLLSLLWLYTTLIISFLNIIINVFIPDVFGIKLWNRLPSGPLPLILGLYHFYKQYTPKIYNFQILLFAPPINIWRKGNDMATSEPGTIERDIISDRKKILLTLSDQFIVDALIFLFVLNNGVVGISVGFISWMIGILIDKKLLLGLDHWKIPLLGRAFNNTSRIYQNTQASRSDGTELTQEYDLIGNEGNDHNNIENSSLNVDNIISENNSSNRTNGEVNNNQIEENDDQVVDEPVRPLRQQFLDVFRR